MSEVAAARMEGDSVEQVAYKLLIMVGQAEKKINTNGYPTDITDKTWILDTYDECLTAVRGSRAV